MSNQPEYLVGKFYTAARKFKQLIGQLPDGTMIPGGPYTATQFVPGLIIIGLFGLKIWILGFGSFTSFLIQTIFVATFSLVTVLALGKIPPTRRSIFHLMSTTPSLIFSNSSGYWVGKPIKYQKDFDRSDYTPTEETPDQPSAQKIHTVTTTKTSERPASGFSRFQSSIK